MFSKFYVRKLCPLWDIVEICGRTRQATDENIIRRMCFACWITKATNIHSECVILIFFMPQKWFREGFQISHLYVHDLSCCFYKSLSQKKKGKKKEKFLPFTSMTLKWTFCLGCFHQNPVHAFPLPHTCHSYWFDHPNNIWREAKIMKFLTMQYPPLPCYLVPLRLKCLSQHTIVRHRQPVFPNVRDQVSHPY